jgi:hypothetical protein
MSALVESAVGDLVNIASREQTKRGAKRKLKEAARVLDSIAKNEAFHTGDLPADNRVLWCLALEVALRHHR